MPPRSISMDEKPKSVMPLVGMLIVIVAIIYFLWS